MGSLNQNHVLAYVILGQRPAPIPYIAFGSTTSTWLDALREPSLGKQRQTATGKVARLSIMHA